MSESSANQQNATDLAHQDNIVINRSPLSEGPKIVLFVVTLVLAVYLSINFPWTAQRIPLGEFFGWNLGFDLPLFGIIPFVLLGVIAHNLLNYRYVLTPEYVLEIEGLLAFSSHTARVHYIHIRGIEIDKTFYQRLVGIGKVSLVSMGSLTSDSEAEICMKGVANPGKIKDMIEARTKEKEDRIGVGRVAELQG